MCLCGASNGVDQLLTWVQESVQRRVAVCVAVALFCVLRTRGVVPPVVELIVAVIAAIDVAPLRRRETVLEALLYAGALHLLPWLGWRIGTILCRTLCCLAAVRLIGQSARASMTLVALLSLAACAGLLLEGGVGVESVVGAYLGAMALIVWSEALPTDSGRKVKLSRSLILGETFKWLLLKTGMIFALQVLDKDREVSASDAQELAEVDEEFAQVPQHFGCCLILGGLVGLYTTSGAPVSTFASIGIVAHLIVVAIDAPSSHWVPLRVGYLRGASKVATYLTSGSALIASVASSRLPQAMTCFPQAFTDVVWTVVAAAGAWLIASLVLWWTTVPTVLVGSLNHALLGWIVVAALSQKLFSPAFCFMCTASMSLVFACSSAFDVDSLEAARFSIVVPTAPLLLGWWCLWSSNEVIFAKGSATTSLKQSDVRRPRPRRKR